MNPSGRDHAGAGAVLEKARGSTPELLREPLREGEAVVWHLCHSGFAVKTARRLFVFDYLPLPPSRTGRPGLAGGLIDPDEIRDQSVLVFASHAHPDHWTPESLAWRERIPDLRYMLSRDIAVPDRRAAAEKGVAAFLGPDETADVGGVRVRTLLSSDAGVAFIVKAGGLTLYHGGDHACWNWDDEAGAAEAYAKSLAAPLTGETVDIAFHVCEPELKAVGWGGTFVFARLVRPRVFVPMHLRGNYAAGAEAAALLAKEFPGMLLWATEGPGDCVIYRREAGSTGGKVR